MPDPTQQESAPTMSAVLAGSPPQAASPQLPTPSGGSPTLAPGQAFPSAVSTAPQPSPQQQQQIAAQQAQAADVSKHAAIGKVASFLFGNQTSYVPDGQGGVQQVQVKQPPGQIFRSLLAGALMGGAMGASVKPGEAGGFLPSFARGAGAGMQTGQQQGQQNYQRAVEQQKMRAQASNEQQKMSEEQIQNAAIREHWNMEELNAGRDANLKDREYLSQEDARVNQLEESYISKGATLANVPNNGVPGNSAAMRKSFTEHPERYTPPAGYGRVLIKSFDLDNLRWNAKDGWTDKEGKPTDPRNDMTWKIYFTPPKTDSEKVSLSGKDLKKFYGLEGVDQDRNYDLTIGHPLQFLQAFACQKFCAGAPNHLNRSGCNWSRDKLWNY